MDKGCDWTCILLVSINNNASLHESTSLRVDALIENELPFANPLLFLSTPAHRPTRLCVYYWPSSLLPFLPYFTLTCDELSKYHRSSCVHFPPTVRKRISVLSSDALLSPVINQVWFLYHFPYVGMREIVKSRWSGMCKLKPNFEVDTSGVSGQLAFQSWPGSFVFLFYLFSVTPSANDCHAFR